jgi:hypothetical protein
MGSVAGDLAAAGDLVGAAAGSVGEALVVVVREGTGKKSSFLQ